VKTDPQFMERAKRQSKAEFEKGSTLNI